MSDKFAVRQPLVSPGWRPKFALLLFILALVSPLLSSLVLSTDLPREVRGALAGLLVFGLPMALMLAVVAMVGQPAFVFIKRCIARQDTLPAAVSVTRYRIGYATSQNGDDWTRRDDEVGIDVSAEGWDSDMICYPCVIDHRGTRFMLYNGNAYGATGFGLAVAE